LTEDARWVIVGPSGFIFGSAFRTRDAALRDCAAVCVLNGYKANEVRVAPARLVVDLDAGEVFNEDPDYLVKLKAANAAKVRR